MSLRISIIIDGTGKIRKLLILILYYVSMTIKPMKLNLLSYSTEYGLLGEILKEKKTRNINALFEYIPD